MRPPRKRKRPPAKGGRLFPSIRNRAIRRFLRRIDNMRFFTLSLVLHAFFILMVGGTVLYKATETSADFEAGDGGIVVEESSPMGPAEQAVTDKAEFQFKPPPPTMTVPVDFVVNAAPKLSTFNMVAPPKFPQAAISNAMRDKLASLGNKGLAPNAGRQVGVGGARAATIFGRRIIASRLGVILDVSASGHSKLAGAVTEIQRGFADATLILYPGCGMMQFPGDPELSLRKFSTIKPTEMVVDPKTPGTGDQLAKAMDVETFQKMTTQPTVKDTLFVAWYGGTNRDKLVGQTQYVFMDLMARGVDTIYWFSDFVDPIDPRVIDQLGEQLLARKIVLHAHNFAGKPVSQEVADWVGRLGGTVYVEGGN